MMKAENTNAPWMGGWMIGLAMGIAAAAIAVVVGEFRYVIGGFIGAVVFLAAGLVMGMPWGATVAASAVRPVAMPARGAPVAAPAMAAPVAAPVSAPVMSSAGPEQLTAPRGGVADDLKQIEGIGPALEKLCNELGFYHFDQIASWSEADIAWVDANMKTFKGRIARDKWVAQAKLILAEGVEAFRLRAKTNDY
ncbi:MAG: NADH:ubiquinone oxidoreductase [Pseudomonadota bacterium]